MNTGPPKVYVVTLNWNRERDTCACLDSLLALDYANAEIVLCDNASRPESVAAIRAWAAGKLPAANDSPAESMLSEYEIHELQSADRRAPGAPVTLIHTGSNLGFAGGMNPGVRYALARGDAEYVWLLNNDTVVPPDALGPLVERMMADPLIGICGSTLIEFEDRERVQACGGAAYSAWIARSRALGAFCGVSSVPDSPQDFEPRMGYVIGASMLVSRRFLEAVGLMDESYFLYSEEQDWAHRGIRAGFRLGYAPQSRVYHKHGGTIGTAPSGGSCLSLFYLYRAKAMFTARYYPWFMPTVLISLAWAALKLLLKGHPDKSLAALRGVFAWPNRRMFG